MLLPTPPERVTRKQLQAFNEQIVLTQARFGVVDGEAQKRFHATHGAFEPNEQKPPGR